MASRYIDEAEPPDKFRQQHKAVDAPGPAIVRSDKQVTDVEGNISAPHMVRDVVTILERSGKLDERAADASRRFQDDFAVAQLSGYQAVDLTRPIGGGSSPAGPSDHVMAARDRVWTAAEALGGMGSPGAGACWDILGLGYSIREHAERTLFGAQSLSRIAATGVLITAAHVLARHYRI